MIPTAPQPETVRPRPGPRRRLAKDLAVVAVAAALTAGFLLHALKPGPGPRGGAPAVVLAAR